MRGGAISFSTHRRCCIYFLLIHSDIFLCVQRSEYADSFFVAKEGRGAALRQGLDENTSLAKAELEISRLIARLDLDAVLKRPTTFAKEKRKQHPSWRGIKWSYDEEAKVQSLNLSTNPEKRKA